MKNKETTMDSAARDGGMYSFKVLYKYIIYMNKTKKNTKEEFNKGMDVYVCMLVALTYDY